MTSVKELKIDVKGMHCAACSSRIERVVGGMGGVQHAEVNLAAETMKLEYDETLIDYDTVVLRVKELGFELSHESESALAELNLKISGMHCASCSSRIEKVVGKMDGVASASVNLASESGVFIFDRNISSARNIKNTIESLGFSAKTQGSSIREYDQKEVEKKAMLHVLKKLIITQTIHSKKKN